MAAPVLSSGSSRDVYRRHLGERVRAVRRVQGMSQANLAEAAQLTRQYVGEIERGVVGPSLEAMLKIQTALGLSSIEQLLSGIPRWGSYEMGAQLLE